MLARLDIGQDQTEGNSPDGHPLQLLPGIYSGDIQIGKQQAGQGDGGNQKLVLRRAWAEVSSLLALVLGSIVEAGEIAGAELVAGCIQHNRAIPETYNPGAELQSRSLSCMASTTVWCLWQISCSSVLPGNHRHWPPAHHP